MTEPAMLPVDETGAIVSLDALREALDSPHHIAMKLGLYLRRRGLVSEEELKSALAIKTELPQRHLGDILVEQKLIDSQQLMQALSDLMGMPYVHVNGLDLERAAIDRLSPILAHRYHTIPIAHHREGLIMAFTEPPQHEVLQELAFHVGLYVYPVLARSEEILSAIFQYYDTFAEDFAAVDKIIHQSSEEDYQRLVQDAEYLARQTPVVRLVASFLSEAIRRHASDVHLRPESGYVNLLYRLDGTLVRVKRLPIRMLAPIVSRIKILSSLDITERRIPQDGHLKSPYLQQEVDVRVSIIPTRHGESVVLRILNKQVGVRSVHNIGFNAEDEEKFVDLINRSTGMLLVTGPTGSGKTTTLYAALKEIYDESINIITVEDPVEYELEGMTQIQLLEQIGFSFPQTLRHILRHDPDVIMIGEIRDTETSKIALESALTGHMVLSTLHTNNAPSAILRLQEMGMSPYLIKTAINGVLGQRLIRLNCPDCRVEEDIPPIVRRHLQLDESEKFYRGQGCDSCEHTGFRGRAAVYELFALDTSVRSSIHEGMTAGELNELAIRSGMRPLINHGLEYARAGRASLLEVYRSCM